MSTQPQIRMGLVGPGFIAEHHIDAVRRYAHAQVRAIAGSNIERTREKAQRWGVQKAYGDYRELIEDPEIDVVHNTTPNHLHFDVSMAALRAGKHVVSDKPLALNTKECIALTDAAEEAGVCNAVTFNYRGNPLIQEARARILARELGTIAFLHGSYLQDWMTDEHVYSWRMDPEKSGASSALADIGSHWCDLVEHVSGLRIEAVLAEFTTVVGTRYSSGGSQEAFGTVDAAQAVPVPVTGEDLAVVLLRFNNGTLGTLKVGQVLPGHKNDLFLEINGRSASLSWRQEQQNELWIGRHDAPNSVLSKSPQLLTPEARRYAHLPGGHQEGWADAFRNVISDIYSWISAGGSSAALPATVCTFRQAARTCSLIEAMLASKRQGGLWQQVPSLSFANKSRAEVLESHSA
jgi:predicted dehydrogenase